MEKKRWVLYIGLLALCLALLAGLVWLRAGPGSAQNAPSPAPPDPLAAPSGTPAGASAPPSATPAATPSPAPTPETFLLSMVGDCTLASSQYNDHFEQVLDGDMAWPFSGTAAYFTEDYLTVANLECSLSDEALAGTGTFQFLGGAAHAEILTLGGVDFVTLANNHSYDFGETGLLHTQAALDAAGVAWAAPDGGYVFQSGDGLRVGLYAARWAAGRDEIAAGVAALAGREDVDLVVCLMHWGVEGSYRVTAGQEELGRAAIDAGAQIVYGSHPHVLQRIDEYGGGYIVNSLGNWSFGGNTAPRDRDTAIVQFSVRRDPDGAVTVEGYTAIPCCLSSSPGLNDYRPVPYEPEGEDWQRAMSKLDGSWDGPDLSIDYSPFHSATPEPTPETAEETPAP